MNIESNEFSIGIVFKRCKSTDMAKNIYICMLYTIVAILEEILVIVATIARNYYRIVTTFYTNY